MSSTLFAALMAAGVGAPALPEEKSQPGPAPTPCTIGKFDAAKGELEIAETKQVPVTEYRTVQKQVMQGGQVVVITENVPVTVMRASQVVYRIPIKGLEAFDGTGKKIAPADLARRLNPGDVILRGTGTGVDPTWAKVLKPDVVILLSPPVVVQKTEVKKQ